jgi:hypothetical protein
LVGFVSRADVYATTTPPSLMPTATVTWSRRSGGSGRTSPVVRFQPTAARPARGRGSSPAGSAPRSTSGADRSPTRRGVDRDTAGGVKILGDAEVGGHGVGLFVPDARFHLHVVGSTGPGKSTLLVNMAVDDGQDAGRAEDARSVTVSSPVTAVAAPNAIPGRRLLPVWA